MSIDDALKLLESFHNTSRINILIAFMNLQGFNEGKIVFKRGKNNGNDCIVMEGYDAIGKWKWNHLINDVTGQPQMRCG